MEKNSGTSPTAGGICLIALGSNVAHGELTQRHLLTVALEALQSEGFVIRSRSRDFSSPAFPAGSGPDFINAAAEVVSPHDVVQTLAAMHRIEAQFGRSRHVRWAPRTLDLDLVAYEDVVLPDAQTHQYWRELPRDAQQTKTPQDAIVPHPRLAERAFVLVPLMDVAPEWRHPVTGATVRAMHDALPDAQLREVVAL